MNSTDIPAAPGRNFNLPLEGLRGLAALMVIYTHVLTPYPHLDPSFAASPRFWLFEAGQGAVLFFFVLSGYVIGLTNNQPFSVPAMADYARRRALRLLPLYYIAVALSVLAAPEEPARTIFGNIFFLQNELPYGEQSFPLFKANTNLWSLNYEVLYYALFPLVWSCANRWPACLAGAAGLGALGGLLPSTGILVSTYAAGWTFWLTGYGLAQTPPHGSNCAVDRLPWPSLMLLWLAIWHLKPLWWVAHRFGLLPESGWMNYAFYDFIPACVALIMAATGRRPRGSSMIVYAALIIPLSFVIWRILRGHFLEDNKAVYDVICLAGLLLWRWRPSPEILAKLAPVGAISYALYIFHSPIQELVSRQPWLPSGTLFSFGLRAGVVLLLTGLVAWLAERQFQPWLRRQLQSSPSPRIERP